MDNCNTCQFAYDEKIDAICPSCGNIFFGSLWDDIPTIINFLFDLNNRCARCIDKLKSNGVLSDDKYRVKLATFSVITLRIIFTLKDYGKDIQFHDSRIPKKIGGENPHLDQSKLEMIVSIIEVYNRSSYLTMSLFQFEDFFAEGAKKLGFQKKPTYGNCVTYLINNSKLNDKKNKKNMLILPSLMRNCAHSSFHYHGEDKKIIVKNIPFYFKNNIEPDCLQWRHIIFSFNNVLEVIEELIDDN